MNDSVKIPSIKIAIESLSKYEKDHTVLSNVMLSRGSTRRQRQEKRSAICKVVGFLLSKTSLSSLSIGTPSGLNFSCIGIKEIAKGCGLGFRRVVRCLEVLMQSSYLISKKRYKIGKDKRYVGLNSVRFISPLLFRHLGVSALRITKDIDFLRKKKKKRENSFESRGFQEVQAILSLNSMFSKLTQGPKKALQTFKTKSIFNTPPPKKNDSADRCRKTRAFMEKYKKYPDLSLDEIKARFGHLLPSTPSP